MERKIRFATAIPDFSKRRGGAERYVVDLCTWMAGEGYEVHVYAERWEEGVKGILLHRVRTIPFPKSLRLLSFAIKATREIKRGQYDVTLGVGNTLEADVLQPHGGVHWAWFWRSLKAYDHPLLRSIKFLGRVLSPKQWVQGYIESAPFKRGSYKRIVAISDMVKEDLIQWYKIPEDRIAVVYNGVDTVRFHPQNRRYRDEIRKRYGFGEDFLILFVSNNFRMKGLHTLIRALGDLKKGGCPPFKLMILGRDRQTPYLRLAKQSGVSEDIVFAGSTDEPEKYYGAADLLVHPTYYDACSLTVLEALASGLPVITTSWNGASGVMRTHREGLVLSDPRDHGSLAQSILLFLKRGAGQNPSDPEGAMVPYSHQGTWHTLSQLFSGIQSGGRCSP
ncbi:MAG: glycosyltransferase family 4 protein [Desulfobacterota bacterium]|nr:glycosyltransferase family 4 protein [Thermodesulfobacteriota bacterium]